MATGISGCAVVTTKLADGNVRFDFYESLDGANSFGQIRFAMVMTSANVTAINTTVNGGAAGTTLTQGYSNNANAGDYVLGYVDSI